MVRCFLLVVCVWLWSAAGLAEGQIQFVANSRVSAQSQRLFGQIGLTLQGEEINHVTVSVYSPSGLHAILTVPHWQPAQQQTAKFDLPLAHSLPGWYHLLVEIRFQDQAEAWLGSVLGVEYQFGSAVRSQEKPVVTIRDGVLQWPVPPLQEATVAVTAAPHWRLERAPLTPANSRLELMLRSATDAPLLGWSYAQVARLDWVENGTHQSKIWQWSLRTDATGRQWQGEDVTRDGPAQAGARGWVSAFLVLLVAFLLLVMVINRGLLRDALRTWRQK